MYVVQKSHHLSWSVSHSDLGKECGPFSPFFFSCDMTPRGWGALFCLTEESTINEKSRWMIPWPRVKTTYSIVAKNRNDIPPMPVHGFNLSINRTALILVLGTIFLELELACDQNGTAILKEIPWYYHKVRTRTEREGARAAKRSR